MSSTSNGYVMLTLVSAREGNKWVGTCEELSTSTYARTLKQCNRDLDALVVEHLDLLEEEGERERFFKRWGIEIQPTKAPKDSTFHVSRSAAGPLRLGAERVVLRVRAGGGGLL